MTLAAPFPDDPLDLAFPPDPPDPTASSKSVVFIGRVVILGLGGVLALCLFDLFIDVINVSVTKAIF